MKLIERDSDVILGKNDLIPLYCFHEFPVFMGCTSQNKEEDLLADMSWFISQNSGAIQLNPLLPMEVIYPEAHGSGCVGNLWLQHHRALASFVHQYDPKSVLEIGGAHGILSREYDDLGGNQDWTIIEPNPTPAEGVTANFIRGFFDDHFDLGRPVDAVVHSHVFEHVYDPQTFIQHISTFLPEGKYLLFSLPNMEEMLRRNYTNCINFEHTIFLTEPYIEYLLHQHGFRILEREYFLDDHSIFYACERDTSVQATNLPDGLYEHNKKLYLDYVRYHEDLIDELNSNIERLEENQKLYLFGAHVFAQYLIGFGLNTQRIECLLDNDPNKQGKRLYGTDLKVAPPKILEDIECPVVILKAGVYNEEIKSDIAKNINSNTVFWE